MTLSRRQLIAALVAVPMLDIAAPAPSARSAVSPSYAAILFDGFVLFDVRPVFAEASAGLAPDLGKRLVETWRSRQFEYQWLRALSGRYVDFEQATEDALIYAARQVGAPLDAAARRRIMGTFRELSVWPDVPEGLAALKRRVPQLGVLSNMTRAMLSAGLERSATRSLFDIVLSTDAARTFKPDPKAYALGTQAVHRPAKDILFVAFGGWDAAGSSAFGYPTFWLNRANAPDEELGQTVEGAGVDMPSLVAFVAAHSSSGGSR